MEERAAPDLPRGGALLAAALVALYVALALHTAWRTGPTFDEPVHMLGGQSYWERGDFRLQPENGNLSQRLVALPLIVHGIPFPDDEDAWLNARLWTLAQRFFEARSPALLQRVFFAARCVAVLLGAVLCLLVFFTTRRVLDGRAALIALALCATSPNLLAHGSLATSDIAVTCALFAETLLLWWVLHEARALPIALSSVGLGLLVLAKHNFVLIFPVAVILVAVRFSSREPWAARTGRARLVPLTVVFVAHTLVSSLMVWAAYGFRFSALAGPGRLETPWEDLLADGGVVARALTAVRDARLLPEALLYGVAVVTHRAGRTGFLAGATSDHGFVAFYPVAFVLKTPLPIVPLLVLGAGALALAGTHTWPGARAALARFRPLAPHVALVLVVVGAGVLSPVNMGLRHILPAYPALFVVAGAAAGWLSTSRALRNLVLGLVLAFAGLSLANHPRHLAFFNPPIGRDGGWRWLVDSSLDWGQDMPTLSKWLVAHPSSTRPYLSYFGPSPPATYGVDATLLPGAFVPAAGAIEPLHPGRYVISATMLRGVHFTDLPLPWTDAYERRWTELRGVFDPVLDGRVPADVVEERLKDPTFLAKWHRFETFRFARLCATLSEREPDHVLGGSILIFEVSAEELARALRAPRP